MKLPRILMCLLLWGLLGANSVLFAGGTPANQEIQDLKAQVKVMMERIRQLEANQAKATAASADTEALATRINEIEEKQKKAESGKFKAYWKDRFILEWGNPSDEEFYRLRIRSGIQFRYTFVDTDNDVPSNAENYSSLIARRIRLFFDGNGPNKDWYYFMHLQLEPKSGVNMHDVFVKWQHYKFAQIQFGRMKIPYSMEYWQSGFRQNGADRTIFTGDSETDKDIFGNRTYDIPGDNARLRVGGHLDKVSGFPTGGMLLYRSQGINLEGKLDLFGQKQFLAYWFGIYDGRDTQGKTNLDSNMLYSARVGINFLPGSDPKGPLGPNGLKNYFQQGDYGYNTKPLASIVFASFVDQDKMKNYYNPYNASGHYGIKTSATHDTFNYGFNTAFLFRFMGFSADLEGGWEEFVQAPDKPLEETWDRVGGRLNLGYFLVPRKWEITAKLAYLERLHDNNLYNSLSSGLGLVRLDNGYAIEDNMQQYRIGINWYLAGFKQYISTEIGWFRREFDEIKRSEAAALNFTGALSPDASSQDDIRFRIQYQQMF